MRYMYIVHVLLHNFVYTCVYTGISVTYDCSVFLTNSVYAVSLKSQRVLYDRSTDFLLEVLQEEEVTCR